MHENKKSFVDFMRGNELVALRTKDLNLKNFFNIKNIKKFSSNDPRHLVFFHESRDDMSSIRFAFDFYLHNVNLRFPTEDEIAKG